MIAKNNIPDYGMETELLAQLIERRLDILSRLCDLAQRQMGLVNDSEDITPLMSLLATKGQLIHKLSEVEKELEPFRGQDPETRQWSTVQARSECAAKAQQCKDFLEQIMQMEKQGIDHLTQRRDQAAERLSAVSIASDARAAYGVNTGSAPAGHFDFQS